MGRRSLRAKIGREVRRLRLAHGWTQAELARRSQVSRSYIQKIESENPPDMTLDILARLAKGFKLNCSSLVKGACSSRRR